MELNKVYHGDCIEVMKTFPDNSVDAIVTDPPYFLINNSGKGFMGKDWESLNIFEIYNDLLWKSEEFVNVVERFFLHIKVELNGIEEYIVPENVNINYSEVKIKSKLNVHYVEKKDIEANPKLKANINSVQGIALTKQEVLALLREKLPNHISVIENLNDNVLFVIPFSLIEKKHRSIVQENVLNSLIKSKCVEKTIHLTLTEEARIEGVIEGMIGVKLEQKFMKEIKENVLCVKNIVGKKKYNVITLNHIEKQKIIIWITSLLFAVNVTTKSKENLNLSFMQEFHYLWSKEALRILKPGGYLLSFGGTRTYHRMACAIEDAGFEVKDCIEWVYGSGFPKSLNVGKSVDKIQGNAVSLEAKQWEGWGTSLKPSHEPIVFAKKPISEKTITENVLKWGTGAINIDESRISHDNIFSDETCGFKKETNHIASASQLGRFPANLIHDGSPEVKREFDKAGKCGGGHWTQTKISGFGTFGGGKSEYLGVGEKDGFGSPARFFKECEFTEEDYSPFFILQKLVVEREMKDVKN